MVVEAAQVAAKLLVVVLIAASAGFVAVVRVEVRTATAGLVATLRVVVEKVVGRLGAALRVVPAVVWAMSVVPAARAAALGTAGWSRRLQRRRPSSSLRSCRRLQSC